jgi:hypothetical protein
MHQLFSVYFKAAFRSIGGFLFNSAADGHMRAETPTMCRATAQNQRQTIKKRFAI